MVVGREGERARIDALLETARRGRTGSLVLVGEPGIGKTALLDEVCATATGMRVLRTTAAEAESTLPFAGLHALVHPLLALLSRLDPPQEHALRIALALAEGEELDLLAVGAGTLALLAEAASEQPLLVSVDDAHWLDQPSADALAFAARRLQGEEIAFLLAVRTDEPSAFDQGFARLPLAPLARTDAQRVLELRDDQVPPGAVERMLDVAAGNPLVLLELPVSLATTVSGERVPPPERVQRAFAARLETLTDPARRVLAIAAAEPDAAAVRRATEILGLGPDAVAAAETSALVRLDLEGVSFRHPLVRSLAYAAVDPAARREAHRALAESLRGESDRDRRAWHLAAAATEPDDELAALLEETADRAGARGGHVGAARALERAARLSRSPDSTARRLTLAARAAFWAGDAGHGLELAEEALVAAPDPSARADALLEIASIRGVQGVTYDEDRFFAALSDIDDLDPDRATRLLMFTVGWRAQALDAAGAVERAARLEQTARRAGSWWGPRGLATVAGAHLAAGDGERHWEMFRELLEDDAVTANVALDLLWAERYAEARHALDSTLREGRSSGNRMRVIWNQACLAHLDVRVGRLAEARIAAAEAITLGEAHGTALWVCVAGCALATVQAWQGDAESCRRTVAEAVTAARDARSLPDEFAARSALGLLLTGTGRPEGVIEELAEAERCWHESSCMEPSAVPFVPDLVEAYARLGETAEALRALERFRVAAERASRRWALAAGARCEGLLAEPTSFEEPFERALSLLEPSPLQLERARTRLMFGERLRRAGQRRKARLQLRAAHETFAAVQAAPWVERAAAELQASGVAVGPRKSDRRSQLTPQELQIAHLVGEGRTNKEIAAQLYLSPKTIEYHLANAYRKLDVHSRVELARVIATRTDADAPI